MMLLNNVLFPSPQKGGKGVNDHRLEAGGFKLRLKADHFA